MLNNKSIVDWYASPLGIYTMVYGGTVYIYSTCSHSQFEKIFTEFAVTKKPANTNRRMVLIAISVLYMLSFVYFIFEWYFVDWSLVVNGESRDSMFWSTLGAPIWCDGFESFLFDASLVVSDGLLVRYILWVEDNTYSKCMPRFGDATMCVENLSRSLHSPHFFLWLSPVRSWGQIHESSWRHAVQLSLSQT